MCFQGENTSVSIICKITITVMKETIYRKAILIIEKQLDEKCMAYRNKRVMLRSAMHVAEMTIDKDVSRKNLVQFSEITLD